MKKRVVTFGEILMRLSPPGFQRITQANEFGVVYAGAEANVAASCAYFGLEADHISVLPDDAIGDAAVSQLTAHGVSVDNIQRTTGRIGIYFFENATSLRSPKIIYDRFHSAFGDIQPHSVDWDTIFKGADWFHWTGITPAVSANAAAVCLEALQAARRNNVRISGDINYRRVLWQYGKDAAEIMPGLIEHCDLIVGGPEDFKNCVGIDAAGFEEGCSKLTKRFPAVKKVAITLREVISSSNQSVQGILWTKEGVLNSTKHQLSPIVDRVGAGDAFMAGLIFGELLSMTSQQTLDFAAAACAFKHSVEGDVNVATVNEIEALVNNQNTGKLLR